MTEDALAIARTLSAWLDEGGSGFCRIFLFGSTVRGDPAPRDVDVRVFKDRDYNGDGGTLLWWCEQEQTDFAALRSRLPRPLHLIYEHNGAADPDILIGAANPVHVEGRVLCVWTPRRARSP